MAIDFGVKLPTIGSTFQIQVSKSTVEMTDFRTNILLLVAFGGLAHQSIPGWAQEPRSAQTDQAPPLNDFDQVIQLGYDSANAYSSPALFLIASHSYDKAIDDFSKVISP